MTVVHLVADTNLFFECKSLEQLPWSELGYDEVVLLLTKPVLDEIDKHKKASGRTRSRAIEIYGRLRDMLVTANTEVVIQADTPRVVLRSLSSAKPDLGLKDDLDYGKNDERLVGIVSTLNSKAEKYEVKLFTDDTGPAMTAADLGVPFLMISPDWRRPSAETPEDKRIKELEKENKLYRLQEPKIEIGKCDMADERGHIQITRTVASPLTAEEIEAFVERLKEKHPPVEDFLPPPKEVTKDLFGSVMTIEYSPPCQEKIDQYRMTSYPDWLERCREVLSSVHQGRDQIEAPLFVRWPMVNQGTRPASKVRIEFEAKGSLALRRIVNRDEDDDDDNIQEVTAESGEPTPIVNCLPPAPSPPSFDKKVTKTAPPALVSSKPSSDLATLLAKGLEPGHRIALARATADIFGASDRLSQQIKDFSASRGLAGLQHSDFLGSHNATLRSILEPTPMWHQPSLRSSILDFGPRFPDPRNRERFYYEWPEYEEVKKGALTCELWRHHSEVETFDFEVVFIGEEAVKGTVECTVHADNLTTPAEARLVVSRKVEFLSMFDIASALVDACG